MPKHTPGPWEINYNGTINHIKSIAEHPQGMTPTIARFDPNLCGCSITAEEGIANAQLMAAAPDMLAALKGFVKAWSEGSFLLHGYEHLKACRDAIQKAEGCYQTVDCNAGDHADCCPANL